ncbi:MAG: hypothetical protein R6U57_04750 [Anaerolineales bacterium]
MFEDMIWVQGFFIGIYTAFLIKMFYEGKPAYFRPEIDKIVYTNTKGWAGSLFSTLLSKDIGPHWT